MRTMTFTTRAIAELTLLPGDSHDVWVWDAERNGLGIRLRRGARGISRTWYVAYSFAGDQRLRLGDVSAYSLSEALVRAAKVRQQAEDGIDPRAQRQEVKDAAVKAATCKTFAEFAEHYLARRRGDLRPATWRERERYLGEGDHFAPFKPLRLNQISKRMISDRLIELTEQRSANVAQAARMALLDMFKLAIKNGQVEVNPVIGTDRPVSKKQQQKQARTRALTTAELAAVWNAAGDDDHGKIVKLLILTGARRQEVGGMRWSELNGSTWTLPAARAKNGHALELTLPAQALMILASIKREEGREHLFGSRSGDGFTDWSRGKRLLDAKLAIAPWVLHDLRRSAITGMQDLGIAPHVVEAVVNHRPPSTVHNVHYNRATYPTQKAEALAQWAEHVVPSASLALAA